MTVRSILRYPSRLLKSRAGPAEPDIEARRRLAEDLIDTMRASPATVGLAAPQIGETVRAIVLDVTGHPRAESGHGLVILFDPELLEGEGGEVMREGCLSVPELTANVRRVRRLRARGATVEGEERVVEMDGFEARVLQHEVDHLDGVLILDRAVSASDLFPRKVYR